MIVKYDSLNRFETPKFTLCNPGSVYTNGVLSNVIGMLVDHEAEEIVFNFNATSELNMRVNRISRDDMGDNEYAQNMYLAIQNRRLIFADNIGYFMITETEEGFDGSSNYKDIKAQSVDIEIAQKMVPYIANGTYKFTNDKNSSSKGILEMIVETLPLWTIEHVDSSVSERWRTFEDVDTSLNCLAFMLQNLQDAFECIFVFDNITRRISVYDQANYVRQTNIHITKDDLINSLDITENADDLYTAVSVFGDENVSIHAINPLGTNTIYDFSYYTDWMTDGLGKKVAAWQTDVDNARDSYYNLNRQYYTKLGEAFDLQAEIGKIDTQITMYRRCRENIVAQSSTSPVDSYNEVIVENGGTAIAVYKEIKDTITEIDNLILQCERQKENAAAQLEAVNAELEPCVVEIEEIQKRLSILTYFTEDEYTELCNYIYEGSYTDEYVIITDIMTYDEKLQQMKTLYDRAVSQLERVSKPTQEFSVDVENFIFVKEFEGWSEQLETGCLINVELSANDVALLFLSSITINYDDRSMKLTFGNRYNKFDPKSLFDDMLGNITKSANTLNYIKEALYPITNGEFSAMQEVLQTSRDLTMRAALAATNQEVVIDGSGYTGKRLLENGEYDPRQIKIVNNSIVFTDDSWESCKIAIGEIIIDDGTTVYGVNADAVMGRIIIGEHLNICNDSGNLSFNNDGFIITNGTNTFSVNPNQDRLLAISNSTGDIFYVDQNGVLHIRGDGAGLDISTNDSVTNLDSKITQTASEIRAEVSDATNGLDSKITQTAEAIRSEVSDATNSLDSKITQTAEAIRTEVADAKNELSSNISQTASEIRAEVSDATNNLDSRITQTANNISLEVERATDAENKLSNRIDVNADGISLHSEQIGQVDGIAKQAAADIEALPGKISLSVTGGTPGSQAKIELNAGGNKTSGTIDLTGAVTFTDLSTSGETTINGANIITGTISADKIDVTNLKVSDANITSLSADKISTGTLDANNVTIKNLTVDGAQIADGTIDSAKIKNLSATKITTGTLNANNVAITNLTADKIAGGTNSQAITFSNANLTGGKILFECSHETTNGASAKHYAEISTSGLTVYAAEARNNLYPSARLSQGVLYLGSKNQSGVETYKSSISVTDENSVLYITSSNGIQIGSTLADSKMIGTWTLGSGATVTSDARKKNSIADLDEKYSYVFDALQPRTYKYNDGTSDRFHIGFIAQEVQDALYVSGVNEKDFAAVCTINPGKEDETLTLRYSEFVALNTWEIQKLKQRVAELESKLGT